MIERLQRALEQIEELPTDEQEELAEQIEQFQHRRQQRARSSWHRRHLAGAWRDLPDDMEETLLRWRRESSPSRQLDFSTAR